MIMKFALNVQIADIIGRITIQSASVREKKNLAVNLLKGGEVDAE